MIRSSMKIGLVWGVALWFNEYVFNFFDESDEDDFLSRYERVTMDLKKFFLLSMLSCSSLSFAVLVKMPDAETLKNNLAEIGLSHFAEKSKIVEDLANRKIEALGVAIVIETHLYDYIAYLEQSGMPEKLLHMHQIQMQMHKPLLFEAILKGHKDALQQLKDANLYQPIDKE